MADYKYTDSTPVDEPVAKKAKPAPKPAPKPIYPDSVPVDEPVKKAKGGTASSRADGCAERGKTRGTMIMCGGGMAKK